MNKATEAPEHLRQRIRILEGHLLRAEIKVEKLQGRNGDLLEKVETLMKKNADQEDQLKRYRINHAERARRAS